MHFKNLLAFSLVSALSIALSPAEKPEPPSPDRPSPGPRPGPPPPAPPVNEAQTMKDGSYGLGVQVATVFGEIDVEEFKKGMTDMLENKPRRVSDQMLSTAMQNFQTIAHKKKAERAEKQSLAYLAENGKKATVKTTKSGLQYEVMKEGKGPTPRRTDEVSVHYHGTLVDGTVFDSSVSRGEPAQFPLGNVIPGWQEALAMMPVGSKWKLSIPQELAYGEAGHRPNIPPKAALIFEVELLEIMKRDTAPGGPSAVSEPVEIPPPPRPRPK